MSDRLYILYDSRACGAQGTDDASVLSTADSLEEARRDTDMFGACACYSYDTNGKYLIDARWEFDYFPEKKT